MDDLKELEKENLNLNLTMIHNKIDHLATDVKEYFSNHSGRIDALEREVSDLKSQPGREAIESKNAFWKTAKTMVLTFVLTLILGAGVFLLKEYLIARDQPQITEIRNSR